MDEQLQTWFRTRDALWLFLLAMILAAWGWDRGRLASQLETLMNFDQRRSPQSGVLGDIYQPPPGTVRQGFQLDRF
jgi:hypothetical protein